VLGVLALSGCSAAGSEDAAPVEVKASASAAPSTAPDVTIAAEPVAIEPSPAADPTANYNGFGSQREWFLRSLDGALSGTPDDDSLIGAGALACDQLAAGTPRADVIVIDGGTDQDNTNIIGAAEQVYCPEFN